MSRAATLPIALLALLPAACRSAGADASGEGDVGILVSQGRYAQALSVAEGRHRKSPQDPRVIEDYKGASLAMLLERGRRATLEDRDEEALAHFTEALAIDPECPQARQWVARTHHKLSGVWAARAGELHASDELLEARAAYGEALRHDPANQNAFEGLTQVDIQLAYRDGLSTQYYNQGIGALREYQLHIARSRFNYASKYRDGDSKPIRRVREVERELAKRFAALGKQMEEDGFYAAARTEHRVALRLDPKNLEAQQGLERMTIEAEAHEMLKSGKMWLLRGEYDKALADLNEGLELTVLQEAAFQEVLASIDAARSEDLYQEALNLEHDFDYPQAIAAYAQLLESHEYYQDARTRMSTLEETVERAERLYEQAAQAPSPEERLDLLRRIDLIWPEYRDVQQQMVDLAGDG